MLVERGREKGHGMVGLHKQFNVVRTKCEKRSGQERLERQAGVRSCATKKLDFT